MATNEGRPRYKDPRIQRQYDLADALIHLGSYKWSLVDVVAQEASDEDVAAFARIVSALNAKQGR